jgi:hypothetical protein
MPVRRIHKENTIWYRVTEVEDLFFYTLYKFKAYWVIGKIQNRSANRIKNTLNIDLKGYDLQLRSTELLHFLYSHFAETKANQRSIHFEDIKKLYHVINDFSFVSLGNKNNTILFETRFPNNLFQLVMDIDHQRKVLFGKSFRIKN